MHRKRTTWMAGAAVMGALVASPVCAKDWPQYKNNAGRTGVSKEHISFPLKRKWTYKSAQAPAPAWPEPFKEVHRMDFDYAFQPVVAGGRVFFGSSADDTLRALDLTDGRIVWRFTAGGPIRFAPAVHKDRLFVPCDDGVLYVLDAAKGDLIKAFQVAPGPDRVLGNGRLISRWPLRSGIAIKGGVVYVSAGVWPSEGVRLLALEADTLKVCWDKRSGMDRFHVVPHSGRSFSGISPQGYLLVSENDLVVPNGRAVPAGFDARTGAFQHYRQHSSQHGGGAWTTSAGKYYFSPNRRMGYLNWRPDAGEGESPSRHGDGMGLYNLASGAQVAKALHVDRVLVDGDVIYATGVPALPRGGKMDRIEAEDVHKPGFIRAFKFADWRTANRDVRKERSHANVMKAFGEWELAQNKVTLWKAEHGKTYALALCENALLVGGPEAVTAFDRKTGSVVWSAPLDGPVRGLAVAAGNVVCSTQSGSVTVFGLDAERAKTIPNFDNGENIAKVVGNARANALLLQTGIRKGYALILGPPDLHLTVGLAAHSDLHVICLMKNAVNAARKQLVKTSRLYGSRIVVDTLPASGPLNLPSYFADVVVAAEDCPVTLAREAYRVLRPLGGRLVPLGISNPQGFVKGTGASDAERFASGVKRGPLPQAGAWVAQWGTPGRAGINDERRFSMPYRVLWYGGPGPGLMEDRHRTPTAPLGIGGRLFSVGQHHVLALNAYNGRLLWKRNIPRAGRQYAVSRGGNFVADSEYLYLVVGNLCHRLKQATGETVQTLMVPDLGLSTAKPLWGFVSVAGNLLYGSACAQGLYDGKAVFALNLKTQKVVWAYKAKHRVDTTAICRGEGKVFLVDAQTYKSVRAGRKVDLPRRVVALDEKIGTEVWARTGGLPRARYILQHRNGVVVWDGKAAYSANKGTPLWHRPDNMGDRVPVLSDDWVILQPYAYHLQTGARVTVPDPLSETPIRWTYQRWTTGCTPVLGCPNVLFFRSGTIGMYDLKNDGMGFFPGMRPGCGQTMIPANGLAHLTPGDSGCNCGFNFQTYVTLEPAPNAYDYWTVISREERSGSTSRLHLNLGAPGDRRASDGRAWLGFPRPAIQRTVPVPTGQVFSNPTWFDRTPERRNLPVGHRAWLYETGVEAEGNLQLHLAVRGHVIMPVVKTAPAVDGVPGDSCWKEAPVVPLDGNAHLSNQPIEVRFCQDVENVYMAFRRTGLQEGVTAEVKGSEVSIWTDDHFDLALTDTDFNEVLHFGLAAGGGHLARMNFTEQEVFIMRGDWRAMAEWNPDWKATWLHAVHVQQQNWAAELALPKDMLRKAGLDPARLRIGMSIGSPGLSTRGDATLANVKIIKSLEAHTLRLLQPFYRFLKPVAETAVIASPRKYRVTLHFAEPEDLQGGDRVFSVKLQGKAILQNFDIVKAAGGPRKTVVHVERDVEAEETLSLELVPVSGRRPLLCGVELESYPDSVR